jgi:predicted nucleotidyltransferase
LNIYNKLQERRADIIAIAAKHGAYNVRVFGSVARHEADSASDLDLLVEMEPERSPVDVVTEKGLRGRIRERVLKEATAL